MKVVLIVIAALVTLGLAAVGVVAAQKGTLSSPPASPPTERVARAAPPAQTKAAPPTPVASPVRDTDALASTTVQSRLRRRPHRRQSWRHRRRRLLPPRRSASPRIRPARRSQRRPRPTTPAPPPRDRQYRRLRQAGRHGPCAHRRDRHDRRAGLRLRAFQAVRFPARRRSGVDLRRRSVAGEHARRAQGARRQLSQGDVLRDRPARDVASGNRQAGGGRRQHHRHPHLVAQGSGEEPVCERRRTGQARDRDGHQRRACGRRRPDLAVLPLPRAPASARAP